MSTLARHVCLVIAIAWATSACTRSLPGSAESPQAPAPTVGGECADPGADGVVSDAPDLMRADRDLDGSGSAEIVAADRSLCTPEDNCHWNVFVASGEYETCPRYAGTISGAAIETLDSRGEEGFSDIRGWWQLADERRMLMQEYTYRSGGYEVVEAVPCAAQPGGRVVCGEDRRAAESAP